jgi:hypothetical protein
MSHDELTVTVDTEPSLGLLRPAIEAALANRPWPAGPEHDVAAAVAQAVAEHRAAPNPDSAVAGQ